MRLATLKTGQVALMRGEYALPLSELGFAGTMLELISESPSLNELPPGEVGVPIRPEDLGAPLENPSKIVAIGLNYLEHASETKLELPESALVFAKFPNALTGPADPIRIPGSLTRQVDYEVELGVVMGRSAKNVSRRDALSYVFGYTVLNDVSARDLQFSDKQWVRGKSLDTFCPSGPVVVTRDEISDPQGLELGCSVNGRTLQQGSTSDMIFGVADLIEQLSHAFTLEPGDLIATGTPSGVGFTREPPVFLRPGDTLRSWVAGIGELVNPVVTA